MKLISQPSRELRLMVRCLELYYRQARSQKEIAQALGVSAATVSRLLKRAYDDGLVRVEAVVVGALEQTRDRRRRDAERLGDLLLRPRLTVVELEAPDHQPELPRRLRN